MIPSIISSYLQNFHKCTISDIRSVGGGSINFCFRYNVNSESFFIKYNDVRKFPGIIKNEVEGLLAISHTGTIAVPEIILFDQADNLEFLVLPFIEQGSPSTKTWEIFGEQMASLHKNHHATFGWNNDNYIGSLKQSNTYHKDFISFFIEERLQRQIDLAKSKGLLDNNDLNAFEKLFIALPDIIPETKPSLVHGDLWSGNFVVGNTGVPYLIDPSIQYNYRETDMAFTYLFGGFDQQFYNSYHAHFPMAPDFKERVKIYNLYPLLVHLNLFGSSYLGSIRPVLKIYDWI